MSISIERLRLLGQNKEAAFSALRSAWGLVIAAREPVKKAEKAFEDYKNANKGRDKKGEKPFLDALTIAKRDLANAEANHQRLYEETALVGRLATNAYYFAREHITIPADIEEIFS